MQDEEDQQLIKELHLHLETEPFDDIKSSNVIAIRHGFTLQNKDQHIYEVKRGGIFKSDPEWKDLMLDEIYFDTPLHSVGVKQCEANQTHINEIDFEVVLVSPLRRTLQTCLNMFKTHPNRQNIKFIAFPLVSEGLCASSCVGYETNTNLRKMYMELFEQVQITVDFSLLDKLEKPYTWQYGQIVDDEIHADYLNHVKTVESEEAHRKYIVELLSKSFPEYLEVWGLQLKRSQVAREEIAKLIEGYPDIKDNKRKLGIVTHQFTIRCLTSDKLEENGEAKGKTLLNCQLCSIKL